MDLAEMGRLVRTRRRALGLSRSALGEAVGARSVLVGRWERGEAAPTREAAGAVAAALGLDPSVAEAWSASAAPASRRGEPRPATGHRWWPRPGRRRGSAVRHEEGSPGPAAGLRSFGVPARRTVLAALPATHPTSFLDDPGERRRYTARWVLTVAILGVLAVLLVWALAELAGTWGSVRDMFRGPPPTGPFTNALLLLGGT